MHCPVCQTSDVSAYRVVSDVPFFGCMGCGSLFAHPDFLAQVDAGEVRNYDDAYWAMEVSAARERSFGSSLQRLAEVFLYCRVPIERFIDIGSGPGFLLDAAAAVMPASDGVFHGVEMFPPPPRWRTQHRNFHVCALGDVPLQFQAGCCIEVIEHLTPPVLSRLIGQLAQRSAPGALYYFGSGQPEYVHLEDPGYLDPRVRGHIVSYSLKGLAPLFAAHGFTLIPLPGRAWAFLVEFAPPRGPNDAEALLTRLWTALPANTARLKDPTFGPLMYGVGLESARCYLEVALRTPPARPAVVVPSTATCTVCGDPAQFLNFTDNLRESGHCSGCGASNRQRQMGYVLRQQLGLPMTGPLRLPPGTAVYNVEYNGPLHARLSAQPHYVCSEYFGPEFGRGDTVRGIRNEDLQALSFDDGCFDIVLSSDVLEHMPDPYQAHREILRVLKPGGSHIFTVPYDRWTEADDVRARLVDGRVEYLAEKLYHGDPVRPDEGILVWVIFGREMLAKLRALGYEVSLHHLSAEQHGILGDNAFVFVATRPR